MARKSRKKINQLLISKEKKETQAQKLSTAAYVRLSSEDELQDSIQTQTTLIEQYIHDQDDLMLTDVYVDNGFTGTNFNRPEFIRMMTDVRQGKIQCIVIKDLSRLGRDFLETGYYIETIFPKLGVRLIAVNDQFDSNRIEDVQSLSVPIKNMVNELYAKDISKKIHAHQDPKMANGTMTLERAPYGYRINGENRFEPDEEVAPVVRMIFAWRLMGKQPKDIAEYINFLGYSIPGNYNGYNKGKEDIWNGDVVRRLIRNHTYTGTLTRGKTREDLSRKIARLKVPEDERHVFSNHHCPLVLPEEYDRLKNMRQLVTTPSIDARVQNDKYKGKIFCGDCLRNMVLQRNGCSGTKRDRSSYSYVCMKRPNNHACKQSFDAGLLDLTITDQVRNLIRLVLDKHKMKSEIRQDYLRNSAYGRTLQNISRLEEKLTDCKQKNLNLYKDLTEAVIDREDYKMMRSHFTEEMKAIEIELLREKNKLNEYEAAANQYEAFVENLFRYGEMDILTAEAVDALIDQVMIYQNRSMEIRFRFQDVFKDALAL